MIKAIIELRADKNLEILGTYEMESVKTGWLGSYKSGSRVL